MKKEILIGCLVVCSCRYALGDVRNVTARQLRPWGLVEVSYEMTDDRPGGRISVLGHQAKTFIRKPTYETGEHHVIWDAHADGVKMASDAARFTVEVAEPVMPLTAGEYCVIDLSRGTSAVEYPVSYMGACPAEGWSDEYKTTKLVLRRVEPGSFMMGGSCEVTLTKPYYIGVFELTQKQYELIMGTVNLNDSSLKGDMRPMLLSDYTTIRGSGEPLGAISVSSVMGKLHARTNLDFDLPTEAQWEYACRAGTETAYNNNGSSSVDLMVIGRFAGNAWEGVGGYAAGFTTVGSYLPNAWGLYDMSGNVSENCLDCYNATLIGGLDPVRSSPYTSIHVIRGGEFDDEAARCTSFDRTRNGEYYNGVRLAINLAK